MAWLHTMGMFADAASLAGQAFAGTEVFRPTVMLSPNTAND